MPPPTVPRTAGQASVELVALLPFVVVAAVLAWQVALAGHAMWMVAGAARAAARAHALGADEDDAARAALPGALRRSVRVDDAADGGVAVRIGVPRVVGGGQLLSVSARARFVPQDR